MPPAILPPTLTDGELTIRPLRHSDLAALVSACQDPEIARWTTVPSPYTREDGERFLAVASVDMARGRGVVLALADTDGRLVGTIGLIRARVDGGGEIGYWTAAEARGRGFATRAVRLLRDWARDALGLRELEILPHRDNAASRRVAERAGFVATGEIRAIPQMPPGVRDGYLVYAWRSEA